MLNRYGNIDYIMQLSIDDGFNLLQRAYEKQADETLFNMWNLDRIFMNKDNFQSFQDYKDKAYKKTQQPVRPKMTKEQIYKQADNIIATWKKHHKK